MNQRLLPLLIIVALALGSVLFLKPVPLQRLSDTNNPIVPTASPAPLSQPTPFPTSTAIKLGDDIPELYPASNWGPLPAGRFSLSEYALTYVKEGDFESVSKSLEGQEHFTSMQDVPWENPDLYGAFDDYWSTELSKRGWARKVSANGFEFHVSDGDSPRGRMRGYVKLEENQIRVVVLHSSADTQFAWGPHDYTFQVFISDPVSLDDILQDESLLK